MSGGEGGFGRACLGEGKGGGGYFFLLASCFFLAGCFFGVMLAFGLECPF